MLFGGFIFFGCIIAHKHKQITPTKTVSHFRRYEDSILSATKRGGVDVIRNEKWENTKPVPFMSFDVSACKYSSIISLLHCSDCLMYSSLR